MRICQAPKKDGDPYEAQTSSIAGYGLLTTACVPVIATALIVKSSKTKGQKQEFMRQLQRTNMEREQRELRRLDWCSEAYRFDKSWALEDQSCAKGAEAYENGDLTALDNSTSPLAPADSTASAARAMS